MKVIYPWTSLKFQIKVIIFGRKFLFLCSSSSYFKSCSSSNDTYPNVARIPQISCSSSTLFLCGVGLPSECVISQTLTIHAGKDVNEKITREFIFTFASILFYGL